jgi:hypothetical protein
MARPEVFPVKKLLRVYHDRSTSQRGLGVGTARRALHIVADQFSCNLVPDLDPEPVGRARAFVLGFGSGNNEQIIRGTLEVQVRDFELNLSSFGGIIRTIPELQRKTPPVSMAQPKPEIEPCFLCVGGQS